MGDLAQALRPLGLQIAALPIGGAAAARETPASREGARGRPQGPPPRLPAPPPPPSARLGRRGARNGPRIAGPSGSGASPSGRGGAGGGVRAPGAGVGVGGEGGRRGRAGQRDAGYPGQRIAARGVAAPQRRDHGEWAPRAATAALSFSPRPAHGGKGPSGRRRGSCGFDPCNRGSRRARLARGWGGGRLGGGRASRVQVGGPPGPSRN